jgi:hypothetical protein
MVRVWKQAKETLGENFTKAVQPYVEFIEEECAETGQDVMEMIVPFSNHLHQIGEHARAVILVVATAEINHRELEQNYECYGKKDCS